MMRRPVFKKSAAAILSALLMCACSAPGDGSVSTAAENENSTGAVSAEDTALASSSGDTERVVNVTLPVAETGFMESEVTAETVPGVTEETTGETAEETAEETTTEAAVSYGEIFSKWNPDAPALGVLIDYVESVTDPASADFIPPEDRIAVFDMDGTVYGELCPTYFEYYLFETRVFKDPSFSPDAEMTELARSIRDNAIAGTWVPGTGVLHGIVAARAYAGMTLSQFESFVRETASKPVDGFEGMTYLQAYYRPMAEVIGYLRDNGFSVFIVSGSDRFLCRALVGESLGIPYENFIGMDVYLEASGQHGLDGLDYVYTADDVLIRTDRLMINNLRMNKVFLIAQEIGRQPVLCFGNSTGDVSMLTYTLDENPYRSAAFMLIADDDVRDYGDPGAAALLAENWRSLGYNVISMRNDFLTIYGENVTKTGVFRWTEEFAG